MAEKILSYGDVLKLLGSRRAHLLIGNGFSIACDPIFEYASLYETAVKAGLSARAQEVFARVGTNNFEGAMRLLDDGHWLAGTYGLGKGRQALKDDLEVIKKTLITVIAKSHVEHTGCVPEAKKKAAAAFMWPFHNVFSTNYDLLAYWVNMSVTPHRFGDGFRDDPDDDETLVFSERLGGDPGMFLIHGGLHLYVGEGGVRKHSWAKTGVRLTASIKNGLSQNRFPLFVAEGSAEKKLQQIRGSGYLSYCFDKLARIAGPLVSVGFAFGKSDLHIHEVIADAVELPALFVGLHGGLKSEANQETIGAVRAIEAKRRSLLTKMKKSKKVVQLEVAFYDVATAHVWG